MPIFQYNSIVALVILRAIWILELMISANKIVSLLTRLKDVCALRDMTSADICCHLMKCLYHGLLSPPIFAFEFNFMSHLKRFYNEKENPFFSAFRVFRGRLFCTGTRACGHQRSHEHVDLVFRSGNQTVLCHRCGAGVGRGFGVEAAVSFAAGSDILYDYINEDMEELSSLPVGTHIGQLSVSWLKSSLPKQFLMYYDYEFLYQMKCSLRQIRMCTKNDSSMVAHSVMEELLIYLCNKEGLLFIEVSGGICDEENDCNIYSEDWVFDLFDDIDIISNLYSNIYLNSEHPYHFSHWSEQQFYTE